MLNVLKYLLTLSFFPCIIWGFLTWICIACLYSMPYLSWVGEYPMFRLLYLLRTIPFMVFLLMTYKEYIPTLYQNHHHEYILYTSLALVGLIVGLWIKTKLVNWLLNGYLISPLLEELIARFILYEARIQGWKNYLFVSLLSSLAFGLLHFLYDPTFYTEHTFLVSLKKLYTHTRFSLVLCTVFWFFPALLPLVIIHSLSNLVSILTSPP